MGGCSAINAMLYIRGSRHDFDDWAKMGNKDWDYDSLIPYFHKIENVFNQSENSIYGHDGKVFLKTHDSQHPYKYATQQASHKLGYDMEDHENLMGFFDVHLNIKNGVRHSASQAYVSVLTTPNFRLGMNAIVTKIIIDEQTKTATGVEVKIANKTIQLIANKEVIISGGAVNSPQILMNSGIGPKKHLQEMEIDVIKDLPVGQNLQDHAIHLGFVLKMDDDGFKKRNVFGEILNYFLHRDGVFSSVDMTNFVGFINTKNDTNRPNVQFHHLTYQRNDLYLLPTFIGATNFNEVTSRSLLNYNQKHFLMHIFPTLLKPKSLGRILLRSNNPFDKPIIQANYLKEEEDVEILLEAIRFAEKLIETKPLSDFNTELLPIDIPECKGLKFRSDEYWRCSLRNLLTTVYHPVGTCKMGSSYDKTSVVDSELKVHGIKHLRVADASVMPTIVSANTNSASMMIGEKASDLIKDDWNEVHT